MKKTIPEPNAELLSAEDAALDVMYLGAALQQRKAEVRAYRILSNPKVREMIAKIMASGACTSEEETIERALKTLVTEVTSR